MIQPDEMPGRVDAGAKLISGLLQASKENQIRSPKVSAFSEK